MMVNVTSDEWNEMCREVHQLRITVRAADRLAAVIVDWVDRHVIDSRSAAADAMLDYAGARCDVTGDEINAFRKLVEANNKLG